ncbi:hypothetical protein EON63_11195 [archaeon]|nr:MAG: hypothetical protein EON63_11195 [archaeon]
MGWLFVKKHKDVVAAGKQLNFDDLKADPVVVSVYGYGYGLCLECMGGVFTICSCPYLHHFHTTRIHTALRTYTFLY